MSSNDDNDDDDDIYMYTSVAARLGTVTLWPVVSSHTETASRTVVSDARRVARVVGSSQRRIVVAVERQTGALSHTRTVAVDDVANVAVESRQEHRRRRSQ